MRSISIIILLSALMGLQISCQQPQITKEMLIGTWKGETLNDQPILSHGFNSIQMTITSDSLEVITHMNAFGGDVTTRSRGPWELKHGVMHVKLGDNDTESTLTLRNNTLSFKPDPQFKPETIFSSEYVKVK